MKSIFKTPSSMIFLVASLGFALLAFSGSLLAHSPIPYWDMWNGYLGFYLNLLSGDWGSLWAQHNEHRILLTRLLFWVDLAWFNGWSYFLVITNLTLVAACAAMFWRIRAEQSRGHNLFVGFFIVAWMFSWCQHENLLWGFQAQFILAQLIPLMAFYAMHQSVSHPESKWRFGLVIGLGLLSLGTMANGVLALPLVTVLALLSRASWRRVAVLGALSVLGVALYFHGYVKPAHHGSLTQVLLDDPLGLVDYILVYLGGPFHHLLPSSRLRMVIPRVMGLLFVVGTMVAARQVLRATHRNTLALALLIFIVFISGSALATAGGRMFLGVEQALSSRYSTPVLMGWVSLLLLYMPLVDQSAILRKKTLTVLLVLLVPMSVAQAKALGSDSRKQTAAEHWAGALALEYGIRDLAQISKLFPDPEVALMIAKGASERQLSVFGHPPLGNLKEQLDTQFASLGSEACSGHLEEVKAIDGDDRFVQVQGWLFSDKQLKAPKVAQFIDSNGMIIGATVSGFAHSTQNGRNERKARWAGFKGYIRAEAQGKSVVLADQEYNCQLQLRIPSIVSQVASQGLGNTRPQTLSNEPLPQ